MAAFIFDSYPQIIFISNRDEAVKPTMILVSLNHIYFILSINLKERTFNPLIMKILNLIFARITPIGFVYEKPIPPQVETMLIELD